MLAGMFVRVYNLESYEYFQMGTCRSLYHSFTFVYMRFGAKVIFYPIKVYEKIQFH